MKKKLIPDGSNLVAKWNYRIVARKDFQGNVYFAIHDAYYHKKKDERPYAIGSEPSTILSEKPKDLENQLRRMRHALKDPILWGGDGADMLQEYDEKINYPFAKFTEHEPADRSGDLAGSGPLP